MLPGLRTPDGALYVTTVAPTATDVQSGGVTLTAEGAVHVNANTPQRFDQGKGFMNNGDLCIDVAGGAVAGYVGGLPVTATGALKCQLNQTPAATDPFVGGLRVGPLGGLYVTDAATVLPSNTVAPTLTGIPQSSNTLTCNPGTWLNATVISYQWMENNTPMIGKTGNTLVVVSPYIGHGIFCSVTAHNDVGIATMPSNTVTIIP